MIEPSAAAFWNRPERYLDPATHNAMSVLALLDPKIVERAMSHLRADLTSGEWDRRHGNLRSLDHLDLGYRIISS